VAFVIKSLLDKSTPLLTPRTKVRPALADDDPPDGRAAVKARLIGSIIHPKMILETAAAIHPINARAVVPQPGP